MGDIWLAGRFEVRPQGGTALPPPQTKVCGVMLVLLAERYPEWVSRRELGLALHSESPATKRSAAVRQTLARLRNWLPMGSLEVEKDNLRLVRPWRLLTGDSTGFSIGPGLDHPWMDDFRSRHTPVASDETPSIEARFFEAIKAIASTDREAARSILCAAPELALLLPPRDFVWAVGATRPKSRQAPNAVEHDMLVASARVLAANLQEALRHYLRAYTAAARRHDELNMAKASAQVMFAFLEMGDLSAASEWLEKLTKADRQQSMHLLVLNAKAAFFWNSHLLPEAVATLRSAERAVKVASRVEQLHYFSNLAVLEAEAAELEPAMVSIERARGLIAGPWDRVYIWNLALAEAEVLSRMGEHKKAEEILVRAIAESNRPETLLNCWYLNEGLAEVLARSGKVNEARAIWRNIEDARQAHGLDLTARLQARKQRILTASANK